MNVNSKGLSTVRAIILGAVAVIIILVIIVFISVKSNVQKNQDQTKNDMVKGNLAIVLTNSVLYLDKNSNYKGFCEDEYFKGPALLISADSQNAICHVKSDNKAFCACTTLKATSTEPTGSTFCVDNRGYKRITQNTGGCNVRCTNSGICID